MVGAPGGRDSWWWGLLVGRGSWGGSWGRGSWGRGSWGGGGWRTTEGTVSPWILQPLTRAVTQQPVC